MSPPVAACRLCYLFCRCTRSISVVPPAQYAHLAAFRGRLLCRGGAHKKLLPMAPLLMLLMLLRVAAAPAPGLSALRLHLNLTRLPINDLLPFCLAATPPAGDSETGSVSSGGGGGVEFLPVNSQLNKVGVGGGKPAALADMPAGRPAGFMQHCWFRKQLLNFRRLHLPSICWTGHVLRVSVRRGAPIQRRRCRSRWRQELRPPQVFPHVHRTSQ